MRLVETMTLNDDGYLSHVQKLPSYFIWFLCIQLNPCHEATHFASEKWPFKRGGLSSGVEINTFMFRFTFSSGLS